MTSRTNLVGQTAENVPSVPGFPSSPALKEKEAELVTGDVEFKPLEKEIKIHWLK
jgi:hypothetical protein